MAVPGILSSCGCRPLLPAARGSSKAKPAPGSLLSGRGERWRWLRPRYPDLPLKILATDIDPVALDRAREGRYPAGALREVPDAVKATWFAAAEDGFRIVPEAAAPVRFEQRNLMEDSVPGGMDLVLCRYFVFTYYRGERRHRAARRLARALRPAGALMIGRKEGLGPAEEELFAPWPDAPGVFRARG